MAEETLKSRAANIAQSNHYAASPQGLLESILEIEDKLKITRTAELSTPAKTKKFKTVEVEVTDEKEETK